MQINKDWHTGTLLPLSLIALTFFVSLGLYLFPGPRYSGYLFFYSTDMGDAIDAERHSLPSRENLEEQIDVFLRELILGPINLPLAPTAPHNTKILFIGVIDNTVYIDFSKEIMEPDIPLPFNEAIENIRHNLKFNFSELQNIVFTIEGNEIGAPVHTPWIETQ